MDYKTIFKIVGIIAVWIFFVLVVGKSYIDSKLEKGNVRDIARIKKAHEYMEKFFSVFTWVLIVACIFALTYLIWTL